MRLVNAPIQRLLLFWAPLLSTSTSTSNRVSARIAERLDAVVDPVLADWWDSGVWQIQRVSQNSGLLGDARVSQNFGGNEFRTPISPDLWLGETMDCLWPGLMPCHLLPLISNDAGDYLCVRMTDDGRLRQIVHWFHGGGDWIPWGENLAEAIAIDAWSNHLPGINCRNAETVQTNEPIDPKKNRWLAWASQHIDLSGIDAANVADEFARRKIGLATVLAGRLVNNRIKIDDKKNGLKDSPPGIDSRFADDESICTQAIQIGPGLSWAWDTAGRAAEAAGNLPLAIQRYQRGSRCSVFSSQSVRMGTHQYEATVPKFSLARLQSIAPEIVRSEDYFRRLAFASREDRQRTIHSYWLDIAASNIDGSPEQLFALHMSAWDVGLYSMAAYENAIHCIVESAQMGGMLGRAAVARLHLKTLQHKTA